MFHNSQSPEADNHLSPNLPNFKRASISWKTTLSLNPEEREALENLIEDVIIAVADDSEDSTQKVKRKSKHLEPNKGKDDGLNSPNTASNQQLKSPHSNLLPIKVDKQRLLQVALGLLLTRLSHLGFRDTSLNKEDQKVLAAASADPQPKVYPPQLKVAV